MSLLYFPLIMLFFISSILNLKFKDQIKMKIAQFLLLADLVCIISGCRTFNQDYNLNYEPKAFELGTVPKGECIFVGKIIDERAKNEKIPFDQNSPWILIPLWPYNYDEVNPVIKYSYFQASLTDSLSRLIAKDLAASELFKKIQVSQPDDNPPLQPDKNAYHLSFKLKKATWNRYLTSYGLSYLGAYLWFFLPKSYGSVVLDMEVTIKAPKNNKLLVKENFTYEEPTTEWLYDQMNYQPPISEFALEEIFPKLMSSVRKMLHECLKKENKK